METKEYKIIKITKKHGTNKEAIAEYMMEYTDSPREAYTEEVLNSIIFDAFSDYLDSCSKPSSVLRDVLNFEKILCYMKDDLNYFKSIKDVDLYKCLLGALSKVPVRNSNGDYINGFTAKDWK